MAFGTRANDFGVIGTGHVGVKEPRARNRGKGGAGNPALSSIMLNTAPAQRFQKTSEIWGRGPKPTLINLKRVFIFH